MQVARTCTGGQFQEMHFLTNALKQHSRPLRIMDVGTI
jgi:hypothetical protein